MYKKVYIAGPMTGIPEMNFPAFHAEAARLRALGYEVVNPAELNPDVAMPWTNCLRLAIPALCGCDAIALLPGWELSSGSHLERYIAQNIGLDVLLCEEITQ
jgi:hypothetical protein